MSPAGPKPRTVVVDGRTFERIPVRTRVLMPGDDIAAAIREHAGDQLREGDAVLLSESAVAIMQGRARDWRTIHPGRLARWLSSRVVRTSWGTGLRSPYAMQYAIELTGAWRILLAGGAHVVGRLLGRKGWFYLVAGLNARMMDAEHTMGVAEFHECVIPAPADPRGTVRPSRRPWDMTWRSPTSTTSPGLDRRLDPDRGTGAAAGPLFRRHPLGQTTRRRRSGSGARWAAKRGRLTTRSGLAAPADPDHPSATIPATSRSPRRRNRDRRPRTEQPTA